MEILDKFHYHEALDRTSLITDLLESHLLDHPAIEQNPDWRAHVENAMMELARLYQAIGRIT